MSPEQIKGEPLDIRSNLFSLGAMFYEMVTERKAFDREDAENLRLCILESQPVPPVQVSPKVHPLLSDLIMKTLSKDPAQRYATGRALLDDLEKCKETKTLAASKPEPAKGPIVAGAAKAAAQSKFVSPTAKPTPKGQAATPAGTASRLPETKSTLAKPSAQAAKVEPQKQPAPSAAENKPSTLAKPKSGLAAPKAVAAAAGAGSAEVSAPVREVPEIDLSDNFIAASVKATMASVEPSPQMSSAAVDEPEIETFDSQAGHGTKIAVDPLMSEGPAAPSTGTSFSDISELPPLKETYVAPPPPPPVFEAAKAPAQQVPTVFSGAVKHDEKPKVQPREVAEKAIKEIRSVPKSLMFYALGGAAALILAIGIGVTFYVHQQNSDDDSTAARPTAAAETPAPPAEPVRSPKAAKKNIAPPPVQTAQVSEPETPAERPAPAAKNRNSRKKSPPPAPMIIPGQLVVESTPQGAQVQLDGRADASYVTPFSLTNVQPGQHTITVSKAGYSTDTRTVTVLSGNRANLVAHLSQLMASLVVTSEPAGASVYIDGRDTGTKTPSQVSVDKGAHVVLVRKMGYLDETMNAQFVLGQTFNFAPSLRPMGNADSIKTVGGKMSKLFGGKGAQPGQAVVSIRTQPKSAQVAINQHIMDKNSPLDVALDPGNYVIDITLTGYAPVHKIITADKGGKVVVDEVLQPQ